MQGPNATTSMLTACTRGGAERWEFPRVSRSNRASSQGSGCVNEVVGVYYGAWIESKRLQIPPGLS